MQNLRAGRASFYFPVNYKLLVVDVDGTLLSRTGALRDEDRRHIAELKASGVPVAIATGRLYSGTRHVARDAGILGPIACVDGSHIVDSRDDRVLYSHGLSGEKAHSVRRALERHGPASFLFAQDEVVHDAEGEHYVGYVRSWSPNVSAVQKVISHPFWEHEEGVHAIVAVGSEAQIKGAVEEIQGTLSEAALVLSFALQKQANTFAMIVRAAGSHKGTALRFLAAHYGCEPSEVVAVGDWINDVPMFQAAGRSFVMAQAPQAVKDAASDRLEAHAAQGGGVAEAIRKAWGKPY